MSIILPLMKAVVLFPTFDGISNKWDTAAEYLALYPNVLLGGHRDHVFNIIITPDAGNKTTEQIEIYYADPSALDDDYAAMRQKNSAMWKEIFIEDIDVVQGMFNGRSAPQYDGGNFHLSWMVQPIIFING